MSFEEYGIFNSSEPPPDFQSGAPGSPSEGKMISHFITHPFVKSWLRLTITQLTVRHPEYREQMNRLRSLWHHKNKAKFLAKHLPTCRHIVWSIEI